MSRCLRIAGFGIGNIVNGFPDEILENATEPYVTSRDNGSGLGLAIAKKIMDDHQGELIIKNNPVDGATVSLIFKK